MAVTAATALLLGAAIAERRTAERRRAADFSVTQALNESPTLATAAPRILTGIRENLSWDVGAIWIADRAAGVLRCLEVGHRPAAGRHRRSSPPPASAPSRPASACPAGSGRAASRCGSRTSRATPTSRARPLAAAQGLHAAFGFPIRLGDEVLGVIEFFSREIRRPTRTSCGCSPPSARRSASSSTGGGPRSSAPCCWRSSSAPCRPRTSSSPSSATSCATRWRRCATRPRSWRARAADDPAIERIQRIIERQVRHMVRLVDDLLDVSRITRGRVELRRERVAIARRRGAGGGGGAPADRGARPRAVGRRSRRAGDGRRRSRPPGAGRSATCCTTPPATPRRGATSPSRVARRAARPSSASPTTASGSRPRCWSGSSSRSSRASGRATGRPKASASA